MSWTRRNPFTYYQFQLIRIAVIPVKTFIEEIETMLVDVPTIRPHRLSVATMNRQTLVLVRVDVNQAWSATEAVGGLRMLADAGVELVEQPIAAADRNGLKRLRDLGVVPVMADEALHGPVDAFALAQREAADVFAVKIAQSGGPRGAAEVAAIANAAHIDLYGGTMLEGGVGTMASAQLFCTFASLAWGTELFGPLLLTEELLRDPLDYHDFMLHVPSRPGLGIELDEDKLSRMRRDAARAPIVSIA